MYDVFIYCGGKCGSSTLYETFSKCNFSTFKVHSALNYKSRILQEDLSFNNIFDLIDYSAKNKEVVYLIDCYRNPIERKISSFFENINSWIPNYNELDIEEIIDIFNSKFLNRLEKYHPMDELIEHYNLEKIYNFDFEKGYILTKHENKVFIKLLFKDINRWPIILSKLFNKEIILINDNLTETKQHANLYKSFKSKYKVPLSFIKNLKNCDSEFKIYNTEEDQEKYIAYWKSMSFE